MRYILALVLFLYAVAPTFTQAQVNWFKKTYPVTGASVESADFNGDGFSDLLVYGGGLTSVLLNKGDGTFDTAHIFTTSSLSDVAFLDFNRDGKLDVAGCDGAGDFVILLGNGDGTLTLTQSISDRCAWVTASDFNKDGNPDVAVGAPSQATDSTGNQVIVYLGDGHGGIASQVINNNIDFVSIDGSPCAIDGAGEAADFNGDKLPDLVITANCTRFTFNSSVVISAKGDGAGHFTFHKDLDQSWDAGQHMHLADVYQDGHLELVGMFTESFPFANDAVAIIAYASDSDGTFFSVNDMVQTNTAEGSGDTITGYSIADVDDDGIKDVVVGVHTSNTDGPPADAYSFRIFKGHTDHTYTLAGSSSLASAISDMAWGDFDKNSRVDLFLARPASTDVWLSVNANSIFCGVTGLRLMNFCDTPNGPGVFHFVSTMFDNVPVNAIQIYVDGVVKFVTPDDVLNVNLPIPDGKHRITVKAWDDQGPFNATTFVTSCPNSTNRTVRICSPAQGMTIDSIGTTHLLASAATNLKFNVLQLYIDGGFARDDLSRTIDLPIALGKGTHRMTVKGWDSGGQFSSTVIFNVR